MSVKTEEDAARGRVAALMPVAARRLTAQQLVHDTLRKAILTGDLQSGTHLVQADIAAQLAVSTTPVREALRALATEGFIQLDPHRGAIVRLIDPEEVREIVELRQILEPLAIRKAVTASTDADVDRAERLLLNMESETDPQTWIQLNRQFHESLVEPAKSPRLKAILRHLRDSAAMYTGLSVTVDSGRYLRTAPEEHAAILDAYRRRDGERAAEITAQHLAATVADFETASHRGDGASG